MDRGGRRIALIAWPLQQVPDPVCALEAIRHLPYPLLLDSAAKTGEQGRYSYLMADPARVIRGDVAATPGILDALWNDLEQYRTSRVSGLPPFQGGFAGYLAYECAHLFERLPRAAPGTPSTPDVLLGLYDTVIAWDHTLGAAWLIVADFGIRKDGLTARLNSWTALIDQHRTGTTSSPVSQAAGNFSSNFERHQYEAAVESVVEYIRRGDVFQVNLSQQFCAPFSGDTLQLYRQLRVNSPASHGAYFDAGDHQVLSVSPERFLRLEGRTAETRPIKGTRRRYADGRMDDAAVADLLSSEKDRAENVMIVDLMRNDLSRVALAGTVQVPELARLESHPTVHHLVSTVRAELAPGCRAKDLLAATFPGGSITGAPKPRAMEIITELERVRRGVYCGSIGYFATTGDVELSIAIRTMVVGDGTATVAAGGGVVLDSDPAAEYDETLAKADALLRALAR